jgi:alpha-mannosidase
VEEGEDEDPAVWISRTNADGDHVSIQVSIAPGEEAVDLVVSTERLGRPDGGMNAGLQMAVSPSFTVGRVLADTPYAVEAVEANGVWKRKYPEGDWMTSPQWFEEVRRPFTSLSLVDLLDAKAGRKGDRGLLIAHDSVVQWFRGERGVRCLLAAYDPWDEERHALEGAGIRMRFFPHGPLSHAGRARRAMRHQARAEVEEAAVLPDAPASVGCLEVTGSEGVIAHALWRENPKSGEHRPEWAGHAMREASGGACEHPLAVRLVEWNGEPGVVVVKVPGTVAGAAKTDLHGRAGAWLTAGPADPPAWAPKGSVWSGVRVDLRPREIATVMLDAVDARKQWRDLDAKREVWATVHRTEP